MVVYRAHADSLNVVNEKFRRFAGESIRLSGFVSCNTDFGYCRRYLDDRKLQYNTVFEVHLTKSNDIKRPLGRLIKDKRICELRNEWLLTHGMELKIAEVK